jgi:hypothetical protein
MLVKSFGCSFIYGSDLPDQISAKPSQLTWPAVFSQRQGHHYRCFAQGGIGNLAIADMALSELTKDYLSMFVIGWTWSDRFDYVNKNTTSPNIVWKTVRPVDTDNVATTYYRYLHSEVQDKLSSLIMMRVVIDSLLEKQFPFVMTYMDELLFDREYNTTPSICALQDYVEPYMTRFEGQTFLNWSRSKGYAESAGWHPLEAAHSAAADIIIQAVDKQKYS